MECILSAMGVHQEWCWSVSGVLKWYKRRYAVVYMLTLKSDNCLLGHQRHSFGIILFTVLKFSAKFTYYIQPYQNTNKRSR